MSSVECLREFVNERLTAAAEEIFTVFRKIVVQYEEEVHRQRKLLDIAWKPEIKLHKIDLPQQHVSKQKEVFSEQQLCIQEKNSSLDQEDPDPPQEQLCSSQEGEQLVLKQETETLMLTPFYEERDPSEPEPNSDHQLLSHCSPVAESQDQKGGKHGDSGSTGDAETEPKERHCKNRSTSNNVNDSYLLKIHRYTHTDLPQQHVCKQEEVLADRQLCIQERNSSLDQEDPAPPQIKEEQEQLCSSQEEEQLVLKQENETFMLTPIYEESDHSEPEPNSDHQLLSHYSHVAESQDQKGGKHGNSRSTGYAETERKNRYHKIESYSNNVNNPHLLKIHHNTHRSKESFKCETCGKVFPFKSKLQRHLRIHTGEKPYLCKTCGKRFNVTSALKTHIRIHTGEKPYICNFCSKRFTQKSALNIHIRIHTGEKPYPCGTCGKDFRCSSALLGHMRIHLGEKRHSCQKCGQHFRIGNDLKEHIKMHKVEKLYICKTCGRGFRLSSAFLVHTRRAHTDKKPHCCNTCKKRFWRISQLVNHTKSHKSK